MLIKGFEDQIGVFLISFLGFRQTETAFEGLDVRGFQAIWFQSN